MSTKKMKRKEQEATSNAGKLAEDVVSKLDYRIATHMKKVVPTKRTKFLHHQVNYFYANKAVDALLDSEWATGKDTKFTDRQSVVDYLNRLLTHKFFHRAKKIAITDRDLKPKDLKKKREKEEREKVKSEKKKKEIKDDSEDPQHAAESEKEEHKKKKKKIKLDMHLEQVFVDGTDAYVWMYDPVPFWYYIVGAMCLVAAVAICLFPLWPPSVRKGVYYLSVAAAGFLGCILGLAVVRFIAFMIIWMLSMGRHHLWLLPNLTEDVGFLESFWPLYHYEYRGADYDKKKSKKKKRKVQLAAEEGTGQSELREGDEGQDNACDTDRHTDGDRRDEGSSQPGSDSDASQHSQPFEMVDKDDLPDYTDDGEQESQDTEE